MAEIQLRVAYKKIYFKYAIQKLFGAFILDFRIRILDLRAARPAAQLTSYIFNPKSKFQNLKSMSLTPRLEGVYPIQQLSPECNT